MQHDLKLYSGLIGARISRSILKATLAPGFFDRGRRGGLMMIGYQQLVGRAFLGPIPASAAFDFDDDRLRQVTLSVSALGQYASAADFNRAWVLVSSMVQHHGGEPHSLQNATSGSKTWRSEWRLAGIPVLLDGRAGRNPQITMALGSPGADPSIPEASLEGLFIY